MATLIPAGCEGFSFCELHGLRRRSWRTFNRAALSKFPDFDLLFIPPSLIKVAGDAWTAAAGLSEALVSAGASPGLSGKDPCRKAPAALSERMIWRIVAKLTPDKTIQAGLIVVGSLDR